MDNSKDVISRIVMEAVLKTASKHNAALPDGFSVLLERPKREGQGDWAANAAMKLSGLFGMKPMELAAEIIGFMENDGAIGGVQAAPPGFINFTLTEGWIQETLKTVIELGYAYGSSDLGKGRRVQVEFVSANPTGPLHLGHGRNGAVGDVMASILEFSGWKVEREYYINDAGNQMTNLGKSTQSRYFALLGRGDAAPFPEDGYPGDYIDVIAQGIADELGDSLLSKPLEETLGFFTARTSGRVLEMIKRDLDDFGVKFDVWFSEKSLYSDDLTERTIAILKKRGYAYDLDGAVWFKSSAFGDDKDRVMIRSNGDPTYFTSDTAYLLDKYERGFDSLIYVWGADHHGYVPRIRSVNEALGKEDESLRFLLIQFVSLLRGGEPVAMSKRAGTFVTLREVMDEVGRDAARFSFVNRKCDTHLEFDLEVAKETSSDNPVYYVQYAHARICSIIREAAARGFSVPSCSSVDMNLLREPCEIKLVREISRFPEETAKAASSLEPHRIAFYAASLAEAFHSFYNTLKVLGESPEVTNARLLLSEAARVTIANALRLVGVSAPEKM
ncbi:MAG: arginine--tRNA ligase [Synergistaceae bacterium]|jgi:arginyl-tRNA synthetase|nr:arginine--tRNA ligase [Synergistaceae bacterium]